MSDDDLDGVEATEATLISSAGDEFVVARDVALMSGTIKLMLEGAFSESKGRISFAEITTPILEKVIAYLTYKLQWKDSQVPIPEFDVEPEIALELLMAAEFLDC